MRFSFFTTLFLVGVSSTLFADESKLTMGTQMDLLKEKTGISKVRSISPSHQTISAFIRYADEACLDSLRALGVDIRTQTRSVVTATIPLNCLEAVTDLSGVIAVQASQSVDYQLDSARMATRVDDVQKGLAPLETPFLGKGVIVGVVDGGLDFTHPAFRTSDRSALRLKRVWNQSATTGTPPEGFSYGAEYATEADILAAETDLSYWSHGSHVMNIAAGADMEDGNKYYGIARESDLVFSNFLDESAGIIDAISYIFKYADSVDKPAVINMSLGTQMGPHDGTSLLDVAVDEMVGPGRIVVGAMGNDGQVEVHIQKTFTEEDDTMLAGLAFKSDTQGYCPLDIWGEVGKALKVNVVTVDKSTDKVVYKSRTFDASKTYKGTVTLQLPYDKSSGSFSITTGISPLNGKPNVRIDLSIGDFYPEKAIAILVTGEAGETVHAWTSSTYAVFRQQTASMAIPDLYTSPSEIGGVAEGIISVGAFTTKQNVTLEDGSVTTSEYTVGAVSPFSNRGPTVDGRMKPDVVAPGSQIVSALNSFGGYSEGLVATHTWNGKSYYYGSMLGTSMAAPHVTGIIATWLGACPTLTPDEIRDVLKKTAIRDEYTGSEPNNVSGYGKIDAYNGLLEILHTYSAVEDIKDDSDEGIFCHISDGQLHVVALGENPLVGVSVYNLAGVCVLNRSDRLNLGEEYLLDMAGEPRGVYIVRVSTEQGDKVFKLNK